MNTILPGFAGFQEAVVQDADLFHRLQAETDPAAFAALAVRLGAERGFEFTADEVQAALQAARRAWIERNVA